MEGVAWRAGLRTGDFLIEVRAGTLGLGTRLGQSPGTHWPPLSQVNGVNVVKVGHKQVVALIRQGGNRLVMKVVSVTRKQEEDGVRRRGEGLGTDLMTTCPVCDLCLIPCDLDHGPPLAKHPQCTLPGPSSAPASRPPALREEPPSRHCQQLPGGRSCHGNGRLTLPHCRREGGGGTCGNRKSVFSRRRGHSPARPRGCQPAGRPGPVASAQPLTEGHTLVPLGLRPPLSSPVFCLRPSQPPPHGSAPCSGPGAYGLGVQAATSSTLTSLAWAPPEAPHALSPAPRAP